MAIQTNSSSISYYYDSLPEETLVKCFSFINLDDMSTVELVCTTWNRVSSDDLFWRPIAFERKINMDIEMPSMRAKVLPSFGPYCKAARIIFPKLLESVSTNIALDQERLLIDKEISGLDLSKEEYDKIRKNPIKFLEKKFNNQFEHLVKSMISGIQVLLSTKNYTVDEFHESTVKEFSALLDLPKAIFLTKQHEQILYTAQEQDIIAERFQLEGYARLTEEATLLPKYLSPYVMKPSGDSVFNLCSVYVFTAWITALETINLVRYEKRDTINPLLNDLSGDAWNLAFTQFMQNADINMDLKTLYPEYIHVLVKKMEKSEFMTLFDVSRFLTPVNNQFGIPIDVSTLFQPSEDKFQDYIIQRMLDGYKQSLLSIRET